MITLRQLAASYSMTASTFLCSASTASTFLTKGPKESFLWFQHGKQLQEMHLQQRNVFTWHLIKSICDFYSCKTCWSLQLAVQHLKGTLDLSFILVSSFHCRLQEKRASLTILWEEHIWSCQQEQKHNNSTCIPELFCLLQQEHSLFLLYTCSTGEGHPTW